MSTASRVGLDPFATTVRGLAEPDQVHTALRAAGPLVRVDAPAGGPVWIVTEDALARQVLTDLRFAKDPAHAPSGWDARTAGLEPRAAEQPSLTTFDGPAHVELRRAHAPLFTARRVRENADRITDIARELLTGLAATGGTVDLMADFTSRFPLTVLLDLLGVPLDRIDEAIVACRSMVTEDADERGAAVAVFTDLAAAALHSGRGGMAEELRDRVPDHITESQLHYLLFALIFAGQLTTDSALGFLLAHALAGGIDEVTAHGTRTDEFVQETLRRYPPAPFTLWRFTTTEVEIAGVRLPARSPVLIDIKGVNNDPRRPQGQDLTFGAGAHYCVGAQLAQWELRAVVEVLRTDFPRARLAVPFAELRQFVFGDIQGGKLMELPVALHG
ncbi:cytochrome P450 [Streptoalloteichus hindustanus]|uniref:Cytochrome P450 n=1 Tax=Streptoalloteichus hindustanus TaxID=2017 RepID=A0A1M5I7M4_STRHI|nr:cytochrome P450 [Streptoalloteichus hindustanus]SHG24177.1 Cytochrome P450 [Streptoalloteichus hindustanus]